MEGCIGTTHWKACETCRNNDSKYGCVIKENIPLSLHLGDWILCDDYENNQPAAEADADKSVHCPYCHYVDHEGIFCINCGGDLT